MRFDKTLGQRLFGPTQATSCKPPSAEYALACSTRAGSCPSPVATNFPKTQSYVRPMSRSNERSIDRDIWRQMCEEFSPGVFYLREPNLPNVNSFPEQNIFDDNKQSLPL